jgi:signal transduction histidine kinase
MLAQDSLDMLVAIGDGWSRYFLCFPGAILACVGLLRQARQVRTMGLPRIALYLTGAAIAFLAYAGAGGLLVPTAPIFPEKLLNYALLDRTIQIPAPVFRSVCGLAMAFFMVRSLEIFQAEDDRRLAEMEQAQVLADDRERIGRDLHDGIIQKIYAAGLGLEDARYLVTEDASQAQRKIQVVMEALNGTIEDIRRYIFDLRSAEKSHELEAVLAGLAQNLRLDTLLEVDLEVSGERCCPLSPQQVDHIAQVAREALSNVVQHAEANHVTVGLAYRGDTTCLTVADDGSGLRLDPTRESSHYGHGLSNMQARARLLGGELAFDNKPGHGLRLILTVPCGDGKNAGQESARRRI